MAAVTQKLIFFFFEIGSYYIAQVDLELVILLSWPPKLWMCTTIPGSDTEFKF
jgi:hypothetical protein